MARWHRYFSAVPSTARVNKHVHNEHSKDESGQGITSGKFNSFLPEVYSGAPNRVERYVAYDQMDADSEISRALNVLSDFSTQNFGIDDQPFTLVYKGSLTETEIKILKESLSQWCSLNEWQKRLWRTFRNTLKYGDQIYIRDPETFKLIWIDPNNVDKIIVNESKGKKIEQYVIRNLDFNLMSLVGSNMLVHDSYTFPTGVPRNANTGIGSGSINQGVHSTAGRNSRFLNDGDSAAVDGIHVVHLSLSEGLDGQWPFGTSILENIYKVYKQKDLLEDAIVIYRIVRAPERRVFYIDVGSLSGERAMRFVERVKNEIYQRRIPNRTGGGQSAIDASYNPIGINEDFFLATNADGKGTKIENLAGGENLGQIDDLKYFNNKMIRGLGIPSSYLPTGADDGTTVYNDGKIGTAYVQEFAFTKYCQRLQNLISPVLDHEFKMFIKDRGIEIQSNLFDLQMWPPQSFGEYRQMQIDSERISVFSSIMGTAAAKYISQRFALMRYLGWTEEEVLENEMMWKQENASKVQQKTGQSPTDNNQLGLSAVGVRPEFTGGGDFGAPPGGEQGPTQTPPEASTAQNAVSDEATNSATSGTGLEGF